MACHWLPKPSVVAAAAVALLLAAATATTLTPDPSSSPPFHHRMFYPNFQHFNVRESIAAPAAITKAMSPADAAQQIEDDRRTLKLLHRDQLMANSSNNHSHGHRFRQRMQRDAKRAAALIQRISVGDAVVEDFGSDVVSGMEEGSGEYLVRIGVGSPPKSQYMVIDSGSDMSWLQCVPCKPCYPQSDPIFNPASSASFAAVSCTSPLCHQVQINSRRRCHSGAQCGYEVFYRDGSYTTGILALETLTFGGTQVRDVAIGCGNSNRGMFVGAAGLLGLGGGEMSLLGQLGGQTGGAFSYCLVSRGEGGGSSSTTNSSSSGSLVFGREAMPTGAVWIPLLRNPRAPIFYYVGLEGLGVGGVRVPIPQDVFRLTELGYGGVVMDTGTAITRFPTLAYNSLRDAFLAQTPTLPRAAAGHIISIFDTCFDLSGFLTVRVPTVSFYFSGGSALTLPARNFLIPVDLQATFCFAFAPTDSGFSIIGNVQQEGIQISFDGANGFVGFGPNVC